MIANAKVPFFLPYASKALPTRGPNKAVEANPVKKSLLTRAKDAGTPLNTLEA